MTPQAEALEQHLDRLTPNARHCLCCRWWWVGPIGDDDVQTMFCAKRLMLKSVALEAWTDAHFVAGQRRARRCKRFQRRLDPLSMPSKGTLLTPR